jgi:hypothetical protein
MNTNIEIVKAVENQSVVHKIGNNAIESLPKSVN